MYSFSLSAVGDKEITDRASRHLSTVRCDHHHQQQQQQQQRVKESIS